MQDKLRNTIWNCSSKWSGGEKCEICTDNIIVGEYARVPMNDSDGEKKEWLFCIVVEGKTRPRSETETVVSYSRNHISNIN